MNSKTLYQELCTQLKGTTVSVSHEAFILLEHFLKISKNDVLLSKPIPQDADIPSLIEMAKRRSGGYPLQYIIGEWEFYGLPFYVGEGVLIPRADTEALVECAAEYIKKQQKQQNQLSILDICSGSGCIAIALKKSFPDCSVTAIEKSKTAFSYLKKNAKRNEVEIQAIYADALTYEHKGAKFDVIVSNPPYLTGSDMASMQKEVSYEPPEALYGEEDGTFFYKEFTSRYTRWLKSGGLLAYEIGVGMEVQVESLLRENGYNHICNRRDLCDIIRVVFGTKSTTAV